MLDVHISSGYEDIITPEADWMQARDYQWAESDAEEESYDKDAEEEESAKEEEDEEDADATDVSDADA